MYTDKGMVITKNSIEIEIEVPGWNFMISQGAKLNRALLLIAITQLEVDYELRLAEKRPTQKTILQKMIEMGSNLSPNSVGGVNRIITELIDEGHIIYRDDDKERTRRIKRERGGPHSPWVSVYVEEILK